MKAPVVEAYPLCWPEGWPRTVPHLRQPGHRFVTREREAGHSWLTSRTITFDRARRLLVDELTRLKATGFVMSSNIQLRNDGQPRADHAERRLTDPGIAIYFSWKGKPMVMASDRYESTAANVRSLGLAIYAMRQLDRHGGGQMMERAFAGFTALPPPEGSTPKRPWWEVMRYSVDPAERELLSLAEVKARYNTLAMKLHPDKGGSDDAMAELNQAFDDAEKDLAA